MLFGETCSLSVCEFVSFTEKQCYHRDNCQPERMFIVSRTAIRSKSPLRLCLLVQCFGGFFNPFYPFISNENEQCLLFSKCNVIKTGSSFRVTCLVLKESCAENLKSLF